LKSIILFLIAVTIITIPAPSIAQLRENDNPGADQPDDSALLGDDLYPTNIESITLISRMTAPSLVMIYTRLNLRVLPLKLIMIRSLQYLIMDTAGMPGVSSGCFCLSG